MDDTPSARLDPFTHYGLILLAVVQGYALYFLHLALTEEVWPATDMRWLKAFYTLVIGLPAFLYLGVEQFKDKRNIAAAAVLGIVLFILGWHLGWVEDVKGIPQHSKHEFTAPFVFSLGVTLFILAFFYRAWSVTGLLRFEYDKLIAYSWQQALTLGLLGLFVGVFWLLLTLWGGLFNAIGVGFFKELFKEPAFIYPVTWLVLGLGLVLVRNRIRLVATVQFMCEALIKALLPLAAAIVVLFLLTLPFTGLQPIWDTGSAAFMMMALTLVLLFFFNAVLSDGDNQPPYPLPIRLFVFAAVALLPISTLLAVWALWLRIDQYGLTPDRLWAGIILLLTAGYTFSYAALILWKRTRSIPSIQTANKRLALVIAGCLILVNTPLADPRAWSAQSQASRLLSGEVDINKFDYTYMRFSLGAYGARALEEIKESEFAKSNPEVVKRIDAVKKQEHRYSPAPIVDKTDLAAVESVFDITPKEARMPEGLMEVIIEDQDHCLKKTNECRAIKLPSDDDGAAWLVFSKNHNDCAFGLAYRLHEGRWLKMGRLSGTGCCQPNELSKGEEKLSRVHGPFLAYSNSECVYSIVPDDDYIKRHLWPRAAESRLDSTE